MGSLIYADGHLVVMGERGTLALVQATPGSYQEIARQSVFEAKHGHRRACPDILCTFEMNTSSSPWS